MTDGEVSKHTHEDAHFCFIVQGDYISRVKDRESVRAASTMLFHPAGTTHRDRFHQRCGRFLTVSIFTKVGDNPDYEKFDQNPSVASSLRRDRRSALTAAISGSRG